MIISRTGLTALVAADKAAELTPDEAVTRFPFLALSYEQMDAALHQQLPECARYAVWFAFNVIGETLWVSTIHATYGVLGAAQLEEGPIMFRGRRLRYAKIPDELIALTVLML